MEGPIKSIAAADHSGADLNVFMCKDTAFHGVIGYGWLGTLCKTSYPGYNTGVNEKRQNVLLTSEVHFLIDYMKLSEFYKIYVFT
jgi:hypothetical protein